VLIGWKQSKDPSRSGEVSLQVLVCGAQQRMSLHSELKAKRGVCLSVVWTCKPANTVDTVRNSARQGIISCPAAANNSALTPDDSTEFGRLKEIGLKTG
jgi:hypothetical protein